mmetsp:Transcript_14405/g.43561  ORF Transcript_14405/g.43561 Transcript_14405/m.43561 type:complete len:215 (+) Transcript_14405:639-1283(+)
MMVTWRRALCLRRTCSWHRSTCSRTSPPVLTGSLSLLSTANAMPAHWVPRRLASMPTFSAEPRPPRQPLPCGSAQPSVRPRWQGRSGCSLPETARRRAPRAGSAPSRCCSRCRAEGRAPCRPSPSETSPAWPRSRTACACAVPPPRLPPATPGPQRQTRPPPPTTPPPLPTIPHPLPTTSLPPTSHGCKRPQPAHPRWTTTSLTTRPGRPPPPD